MVPRAHSGPVWAQVLCLDGAAGCDQSQASEGHLEESDWSFPPLWHFWPLPIPATGGGHITAWDSWQVQGLGQGAALACLRAILTLWLFPTILPRADSSIGLSSKFSQGRVFPEILTCHQISSPQNLFLCHRLPYQ